MKCVIPESIFTWPRGQVDARSWDAALDVVQQSLLGMAVANDVNDEEDRESPVVRSPRDGNLCPALPFLRQFSPVERLLETLLSTYREWGGTAVPNIAILDWENLPTSNEFVLLRNHFTAHGVPTIICSPDALEYRSGELRCGIFRVDLVYKRILIHEFLARYDDTHPLIRAYVNHDVCLVNPFRCKIMHKKAAFEMLTDDAHQNWFTQSEKEAFRHSVPWTRRVADRKTTRKGRPIDLLEVIHKNRSLFVLKPNDDYGGRGVYLGSRLDEREWDNAIATALSGDYVVQEAIDLHTEEFPMHEYLDQCWVPPKPVSPRARDARHVPITAENDLDSDGEAHGCRCDRWGHPCPGCVKSRHEAEQNAAAFGGVTNKR